MKVPFSLYWGDFHTHLQDEEKADTFLKEATCNLDFTAVLSYPFLREKKKGLLVETTRQRPEFLSWWEKIQLLSANYHRPGKFITFPGYEWHGNRTRYGDHNVIYFQEGYPLDDTWALPALYRRMRKRKAFVIPHHTGYLGGWRGKDWSYFDPFLSPVMEIFSSHGSSEGILTGYGLDRNSNMGPLTSGGTFQDALNAGVIVGVIGSNDGPGLPGRWGLGRAGVWAEELTRSCLWEAIAQRRTFAVTGDRIKLFFTAEGHPMGSVFHTGKEMDLDVFLEGSDSLDRVELIHNGSVVDCMHFKGPFFQPSEKKKNYKIKLEMGWGPANAWGFSFPGNTFWRWKGELKIEKGLLLGIEKCITLPGQRVEDTGRNRVSWDFQTRARTDSGVAGTREGLIFEIEGNDRTLLYFSLEGIKLKYTLGQLINRFYLVPLLRESKKLIREAFNLTPETIGNPDDYFFNARKFLLHRACPEEEYRQKYTFRKIRLKKGHNYLYLRVSQRNGQMAWSSPVWPISC